MSVVWRALETGRFMQRRAGLAFLGGAKVESGVCGGAGFGVQCVCGSCRGMQVQLTD